MEISQILDPKFLISTFGLIGIFAIVFAESGLFFGFFFPGDSLLFTAGLLSSQGFLNPYILFIGIICSAILGDNVGYAFGKKIGPMIFQKDDSFFFKKRYVLRAQEFYEKYGKKTIILARFVPIVRTFAPILAGVGNMNYKNFFFYNCFGSILWGGGMTGLGFVLGASIPGIDKYILPIIVLIIFFSFLPVLPHILKKKIDS